MNNMENAAVERTTKTRTTPQRAVFDPMKFAREVVTEAGKNLTLDLKHKKAWFRLACPNGGVVLNPLRVTDQMAIFEARLFADTDDRNPLASFTATRNAGKAKDGQYIREAQDEALDEALENAGFGIPLYGVAPAATGGEELPAASEAEPEKESAKTVEAVETAGLPVEAPAPGKREPASVVVDIATRRSTAVQKQPESVPAAQTQTAASQSETAPPVSSAPTAEPASVDTASAVTPAPTANTAPAADPAPAEASAAPEAEAQNADFTADMTVDEIRARMTLEQARVYVVKEGTCKGWTLEQVAADRPSSLKWLRYTAPFADNVLKAAADILLNSLEMKKAG